MSGRGPDWQGWLALLDAPGLGSSGLAALMRRHPTPEAARAEQLARTAGRSGRPGLEWPESARRLEIPTAVAETVLRLGIEVLTLRDRDYPPQLAATPDPPPLLFVQGRVADLTQPSVAVVGSRRCSGTGARNAEEIGYVLVKMGYSVVSGLALGIDGAAHRGALDGGGPSVAVLGCGHDVDYPRPHRQLRRRMLDLGAVVSEFPPGTPPHPPHFPRRNRVISGLARAVVVVEAGQSSGALITVEYALQQGREVWAVPGPFGSPLSRGCARLLRDGAAPLTDFRDLADVEARPEPRAWLPAAIPSAAAAVGPPAPPDRPGADPTDPPPPAQRLGEPGRADMEAPSPIGLAAELRRLVDLIDEGGSSVDDLVRASGVAPGEIQQAMVQLELAGLVRALPGGRVAPRCGRPRPPAGAGKGSKPNG